MPDSSENRRGSHAPGVPKFQILPLRKTTARARQRQGNGNGGRPKGTAATRVNCEDSSIVGGEDVRGLWLSGFWGFEHFGGDAGY
jgi:hypothetical protein